MMTPWGYAEHHDQITENVYEVETAGHGGILVHESVAPHLLSDAARAYADRSVQPWYAYEEDCNWSFFGYEQPALYAAFITRKTGHVFSEAQVKQDARAHLVLVYPDYLAMQDETIFASDKGTLRPVTTNELLRWADVLRQEQDWHTVRDFAQQCYGPKAAFVAIETYDDGEYPCTISNVTVQDAQGKDLPLDLTSPYWDQEQFYSNQGQCMVSLRDYELEHILRNHKKQYEASSPQEQDEWLIELLDETISEDSYSRFDLPYDRYDPHVYSYDLTQSPLDRAGFPSLFVACEQRAQLPR